MQDAATTEPPRSKWMGNPLDDPITEMKRKFPPGKQAFLWEEEWPVFKFGYDKFIAIRLEKTKRHDLQFVLGDFDLGPENKWAPGKKSIWLNDVQFTRLCGMLFNGFLDLNKDPRNRDSEGRLSQMHNLGENVFFVWSTIDQTPIANVRLFSITGNGDWRPTLTGMSVGLKTFDWLKLMVKDLTIFKAAKAVYDSKRSVQFDVIPPVLPELEALETTLPFIMWQKFIAILQENCARCNELRLVFGIPFRREVGHTCNWGEKDLVLTNEIC
jgi:hypothetical protein